MTGTKIYYPSHYFEQIRKAFIDITASFGAELGHFPGLQISEIFFRSAGQTSDICDKELFVVDNFKNPTSNVNNVLHQKVLKPEGTAVVIDNLGKQVIFDKTLRISYFDKMYRYNRPQKYRYRELTQAGVEFFGSGIAVDFEVICSAYRFLSAVCSKPFTLRINHIGNAGIRAEYARKLGEYFVSKKDIVSENTYKQALSHPLRALDKLTASDKLTLTDLPKLLDMTHNADFAELLKLLVLHNIPYEIDPFIIRGLDYYSGLVFEFTTDDTTLLAGGRYDQLVNILTHQDCPGAGWAAGIDRIIDYMEPDQSTTVSKCVGILSMDQLPLSLNVAMTLRSQNIRCMIVEAKNLSTDIKNISKHCSGLILLGENEMLNGTFQYKNLHTGQSTTCPTLQDLVDLMLYSGI